MVCNTCLGASLIFPPIFIAITTYFGQNSVKWFDALKFGYLYTYAIRTHFENYIIEGVLQRVCFLVYQSCSKINVPEDLQVFYHNFLLIFIFS
jgi:hypothetical protein